MVKKITGVCFLFLVFQSCHVGRFFIYNFADSRDYKKFPSKPIYKAVTPFYFTDVSSRHLLKLPSSVKRRSRTFDFETALRKTGTLAFLVIRNDSILYQWYRPGRERNEVITSFSISKSFVSSLIAIAVEEGHIKSIDDPITDYIAYLDKTKFGKITIAHVLNMRSGLKFNENYFNPFGDIAKYYYGTHLKKYLRHLDVAEAPGQKFHYLSINTQILGLVLENATGKSLTTYLQEKLWGPLGMEFDASWSVDSKKHQTEKAFCCINARAIDLAKLGSLYTKKGKWQGRQIVPEAWVEQTASTYGNYSNHWWHTRNNYQAADSLKFQKPYHFVHTKEGKTLLQQPSEDLFAQGLLGQYLYVYPAKNMVILRLSKREGFGVPWPYLFKEIARMN